MDEEEYVAPEVERATAGLQDGLETCHKIVSDYRSMLLSLEHPDLTTSRGEGSVES
ncbi:hypothetical protein LZ016_01195 [Sphingomonas sp. SM33]|uniref:Uncharacterized protein n=1 Tax=Sphingomonas telluris TaxID=2907998 RepID=A0ABS9VJL2_9SPHN|nr:hypothetical protein [Sphingomonas telluris]MCH8614724.1 hypothetical protein [Sphingomonas telluris]